MFPPIGRQEVVMPRPLVVMITLLLVIAIVGSVASALGPPPPMPGEQVVF